MLYNFLLILLILDGIVLTAVVLLQAGQGGGLASLGGGTTDLVMGGRQAVTILTKTSWVAGGLFMFLSLMLSIVASNRSIGETDVQRQLRQQAPAAQQPIPTAPLQTTPSTAPTTSTATPPATPAPAPATKP